MSHYNDHEFHSRIALEKAAKAQEAQASAMNDIAYYEKQQYRENYKQIHGEYPPADNMVEWTWELIKSTPKTSLYVIGGFIVLAGVTSFSPVSLIVGGGLLYWGYSI